MAADTLAKRGHCSRILVFDLVIFHWIFYFG